MANFKYTSDILSDVLFRAGEPTDGTSEFQTQALNYINRAYQMVCMGGAEISPDTHEDWVWLRKSPPAVVVLEPAITTTTITTTKNSSSATLSVAPSNSIAGYVIIVEDARDIYRVSAHTAGQTTITLDSVYTTDSVTAGPCIIAKVEYTLASDILKIISPMRGTYVSQVEGIDSLAMDREYPLSRVISGCPKAFSIVSETTTGVKVRFSHYGSINGDYIRLEYDYLYRPADLTNAANEEPVIPPQFRRVLSDLALYFIHMDKNDSRADAAGVQAKSLIEAMAAENRNKLVQMSETFGKIQPRQSDFDRGLLRTSTGIILS